MPLERRYVCNGLNSSKAINRGTMILGMLTIVLLVLYSALRASFLTTFLSPPSSSRVGNTCTLIT
ncbi:putative serine incorporator/TMS membrane protein [Helianthus anomalus]